jgi:hypothetical protein
VSRALRGTRLNCGHEISFPSVRLEVPDDAFGELGNVRSEARGGEVKTEDYARRGVPYPQTRVLAQQEYHDPEQQRQGYRYRQSITPFPCRAAPGYFRASYSTREPLRFQGGNDAVPVRFATAGRPFYPLTRR